MTDKPFSICILGSSHTGCIVTAWRKRAFPVTDNVSVTFFASRALSLSDLELQGRALVPRSENIRRGIVYTSGGKEQIDIDAYDAFVTVALGFSIKLSELCQEYGTAQHLKWGPVPSLVSQACFHETIKRSLADSLYLKLTDKIRGVSSAPILNVVKPYPPQTALDEAPLKSSARMHDPVFLGELLAQSKSAAQELSAEHNSEVLWPPPDTMGLPGFTKPEFAQGALALVKKPRGNADEDGKHMNEEYGYHILNAIFARLDEMAGGRVIAKTRRQMRRAMAQ